MQNAQTIYQQTILPLPDSEKLRLATLILQNLSSESGKRISATDLPESLQDERAFENAEAVEHHIKTERESWDN